MEYILPGKKLQHVANPSFLFYKCISSKEYNSDSKDKFNNLKKIAGSLVSSYKFGNLDAYAAYKNRMESVADGLKDQGYVVKRFMLKAISGLCIGMGRDSAIENGITLERNLGIPIIPSSSIKGVIRSYVTLYGTDEERSKTNRYFGSDDDDNPKSGEVDFLNAYMISGTEPYRMDIINNHFQDYYSEGKAPNDWFSPNPVHFLRISEGKVFEFTILGKDKEIVSEVQNLIERAFKEVGIGGKTAVGYGRMTKV